MELLNIHLHVLDTEQSYQINQPVGKNYKTHDLAQYFSALDAQLNTSVMEILRKADDTHNFESIQLVKGKRLICMVGDLSRPVEMDISDGKQIEQIILLKDTINRFVYESQGYDKAEIGLPKDGRKPALNLQDSVPENFTNRLPAIWGEFWYQERWLFTQAKNTPQLLTYIDNNETAIDRNTRIAIDEHIRFMWKEQNEKYLIADLDFSIKKVDLIREIVNRQDQNNISLVILIGSEIDVHNLELTPNIEIGILCDHLNKLYPNKPLGIYIAEALPMTINAEALEAYIKRGYHLYLARDKHSTAKTVLRLEDSQHSSGCVWILPPSFSAQEPAIVGRRSNHNIAADAINIDLSATKSSNIERISRKQALIFYSEGAWYIQRFAGAKKGREVFVNTQRVTDLTPVRIKDGDSITFGLSLEDLSVRLHASLAPYERTRGEEIQQNC